MLMLVGDAACRVLGSRRYGRGKVGGFQVGARETTVECPAGKEREGGGGRELCCLKGPVRLPHMCVPCGRGTGGGKERLTVDHGTR